ncbi:MAG: cold shock domain-containing protein [Chloroflexi bacterium]|nr:cold shock domain-containing protein [Chloroflexota bacterium]
MRGTITSLSPERGFGFIRGDDGQVYFLHRGALTGVDFENLAPGVTVIFDPGGLEHGDQPGEHSRASDVRLAPDAVPAADNTVLPTEKVNPPSAR